MIKEIREELDQLGEESYKQFNQKLPMWSINLLLTAAGVLAVLLGGRKIFGGHQVKSS